MTRAAVARATAAERAAREAVVQATAMRLEAERAERGRKRVIHDRWINRQIAAARPDPSESLPEMIVIRKQDGECGGVVTWDVICDTQPGRTRRGEKTRRGADVYARELRSRGHVVRVIQTGEGRG